MTAPETSAPARVGVFERAGAERAEVGVIERMRADPAARVLVTRIDATPLGADGSLALQAPADVVDDAEWALLGRDGAGAPLLLAALGDAPAAGASLDAPGGWQPLRAIGGSLAPGDASALLAGVALGRWLHDAPFCPACGGRTVVASAGWSRHCPVCGREHFPRTDPAVIVAITRDDDVDALLLGAHARWGGERFSCFAGFAEAGESLEDAVVREVAEEAGVFVSRLRYAGSQGWPYPRSLMLGFYATAPEPDTARPDGDEISEVRWFTRAEIGEALAGRGPVSLPGPASIAHRLIAEWHAQVPDRGGSEPGDDS